MIRGKSICNSIASVRVHSAHSKTTVLAKSNRGLFFLAQLSIRLTDYCNHIFPKISHSLPKNSARNFSTFFFFWFFKAVILTCDPHTKSFKSSSALGCAQPFGKIFLICEQTLWINPHNVGAVIR